MTNPAPKCIISFMMLARKNIKVIDLLLKIFTGVFLGAAFFLTFTPADYYVFSRVSEFGFFFVISRWICKSGLLLLPLAVYYKKKSCADIAKYILPVFVVLSCSLFGKYFDISKMNDAVTPAEKVLAHYNEFVPKALNMTVYFVSAALELGVCVLLFLRDGFKVNGKSFIYLPFAIIGVIPPNIFENFFDINDYPENSPFRFKSFSVWHFIALAVLIGFTIGVYFFLRKKSRRSQNEWLAAGAIAMLVHYHSKTSFFVGDGYNVYHHISAAMPLFICNIGTYIAALSIFLRKRVLYAISFFVHAVGALSVFVYFGRDGISDYGIWCSRTIILFCITHCLLFALSVMPTALGHYKFRPKDSIIPLAYYCVVIIAAAISSGLVTSASMSFSYDGYTLSENEWIIPNYAFTQTNPLPIPVPVVPLKIWKCELNLLYLIALYAAYVALFWSFTGMYYAFLAVRKAVLARLALKRGPVPAAPAPVPDLDEFGELLATTDETTTDDSAESTEKTEEFADETESQEKPDTETPETTDRMQEEPPEEVTADE